MPTIPSKFSLSKPSLFLSREEKAERHLVSSGALSAADAQSLRGKNLDLALLDKHVAQLGPSGGNQLINDLLTIKDATVYSKWVHEAGTFDDRGFGALINRPSWETQQTIGLTAQVAHLVAPSDEGRPVWAKTLLDCPAEQRESLVGQLKEVVEKTRPPIRKVGCWEGRQDRACLVDVAGELLKLDPKPRAAAVADVIAGGEAPSCADLLNRARYAVDPKAAPTDRKTERSDSEMESLALMARLAGRNVDLFESSDSTKDRPSAPSYKA